MCTQFTTQHFGGCLLKYSDHNHAIAALSLTPFFTLFSVLHEENCRKIEYYVASTSDNFISSVPLSLCFPFSSLLPVYLRKGMNFCVYLRLPLLSPSRYD